MPSVLLDAVLDVDIFHSILKPQMHVSYEALSYVWGDATDTVDVNVDRDSLVPITKSLPTALVALRGANHSDNPQASVCTFS